MNEPPAQLNPRPRVDYRSRFDPASARLEDSVANLVKLRGAVCIRANREQDAGFLRSLRHRIVQIETVHGAVDLEGHPRFVSGAEDAFEVQFQRLAFANQPAGRMPENVNMRIRERIEQAARGLIFVMTKQRVNRGDNDIQPRENLIGIIQLAAGQDINFGSDQNAGRPVTPFLLKAMNFFDLLFQPI